MTWSVCRSRSGVSEAESLSHLIFVNEYTFRFIDPRPSPGGEIIKVVDMKVRGWGRQKQ